MHIGATAFLGLEIANSGSGQGFGRRAWTIAGTQSGTAGG